MSRAVLVMTERWDGFENILGAQGGRGQRRGVASVKDTLNRSLTMPLLCCRRRLELEGVHEVEGGLAQIELGQPRPKVDHVAWRYPAKISSSAGAVGDQHAPSWSRTRIGGRPAHSGGPSTVR